MTLPVVLLSGKNMMKTTGQILNDPCHPMALACPPNRAVNTLKARGDWPHPRGTLTLDEVQSDFHILAAMQANGPIGSTEFRNALAAYLVG